ncbi:MFS transporter [Crocinitomix sp.]|nr:MFS transporter [Crocinitomix sp.]
MMRILNFYFDSFKGLSKEVWWLALITLINRAGTMVIPFLSLYLTEDLHFSLADLGWIMTAFGLGSVIGSWRGGKFTDKIGGYKVMVISLVASGFLFIVFQFLHTLEQIAIGIFVVMLVADMFRPAIFVALNTYSKPENKTRSVTLIRLAINLGFAAGPAIGGLIITGIGYGSLFWVDGLTCIFAGLLLVKILNPRRAPLKEEVLPLNSKSAYKDVHLLSELEIGLLFACNGLLIFLCEMPLVKWLEGTGKSLTALMIIGGAMVGLSFIVLNLTSWGGILLISMFLITFGEMIMFPFSNAYAMNRSNRGSKGEYLALYMMAFSFSHIFSHNGGMQLIDHFGFTTTWNIISIISVVSLILLTLLKYFIKKEQQTEVELSESEFV